MPFKFPMPMSRWRNCSSLQLNMNAKNSCTNNNAFICFRIMVHFLFHLICYAGHTCTIVSTKQPSPITKSNSFLFPIGVVSFLSSHLAMCFSFLICSKLTQIYSVVILTCSTTTVVIVRSGELLSF